MKFQHLPYIITSVLLLVEISKQINMKIIINRVRVFFALIFSGQLIAFIMLAVNPLSLRAMKDLNDSAHELEKCGKEYWGPDYKVPRYNLIDFFV